MMGLAIGVGVSVNGGVGVNVAVNWTMSWAMATWVALAFAMDDSATASVARAAARRSYSWTCSAVIGGTQPATSAQTMQDRIRARVFTVASLGFRAMRVLFAPREQERSCPIIYCNGVCVNFELGFTLIL